MPTGNCPPKSGSIRSFQRHCSSCNSGATCAIVDLAAAKLFGLKIYPATQRATQAGGTGLKIVGEVHVTLYRDKLKLQLDALVAEKLYNTQILGGMNFLWDNRINPRVREQVIEIQKHIFPQTNLLSIAQTMSVQASIEQSPTNIFPISPQEIVVSTIPLQGTMSL